MPPPKVPGFVTAGDALNSAGWDTAASWRRGMMHAVERVDAVLARKLGPRAQLAAIRTALDELTELQRQHHPKTYAEAFAICSADHEARREQAA